MTVKSDIEDEIGRNGWRLVGKVTVAVLGIAAVPFVVSLVMLGEWKGTINTRLDGIEGALHRIERVVEQQSRDRYSTGDAARDLNLVHERIRRLEDRLDDRGG